jgi:hypothetical protein
VSTLNQKLKAEGNLEPQNGCAPNVAIYKLLCALYKVEWEGFVLRLSFCAFSTLSVCEPLDDVCLKFDMGGFHIGFLLIVSDNEASSKCVLYVMCVYIRYIFGCCNVGTSPF